MTPPKTLPGKWTPHVRHKSARFRTTLRLEADGNAEIYTNATGGNSNRKLRTTGRWQLLDNKTLHLWGTQAVTWKILKLNSSRMEKHSGDCDYPAITRSHGSIRMALPQCHS
jgi:hypothetical protein